MGEGVGSVATSVIGAEPFEENAVRMGYSNESRAPNPTV
jgi:hypothetical protein